MLKKIALLVVLFALPLGAMAQKFAHMNSQEVIVVMPEYTKAQADLEAMSKKYTQEMERTQSEFNKKVQEFQQQADSLPSSSPSFAVSSAVSSEASSSADGVSVSSDPAGV